MAAPGAAAVAAVAGAAAVAAAVKVSRWHGVGWWRSKRPALKTRNAILTRIIDSVATDTERLMLMAS